MGKYLINFIWVCCFFVILEILLYLKDYNELIILDAYVNYEIKNNSLTLFYDEKCEVVVDKRDKVVSYSIIMKRESIFRFKKLKKIKYNGIVY